MKTMRLNMPQFESLYILMLCLCLALSTFTGCENASAGQEGPYFIANGKKINIESFEREVNEMLDVSGVPGISVAIIENDSVVFANGYGKRKQGKSVDTYQTSSPWSFSVKDVDTTLRVDRNTVFNGASLSKTYLAMVAYQLVDEGLLDMDKPLHEYLEYELLQYDERYKKITARMALSHSSGLENWRYQNDGSKLEIINEPGTEYLYSGEGYFYLYYVISKLLDDQSLADFTQERVMDKLGLKNSYVKYSELKEGETWREGTPNNFAVAHPLSGGQYLMRNINPNPAFANHFTAEDYAKVVLGMFNPEFVSADRRKDLLDARVRMGKSSVFYAPAFKLMVSEGDTLVAHGGDNVGIKNLMFYSPVQKRGFVIMTNADHGKSLGEHINKLTVNLDLSHFWDYKHDIVSHIQYPSAVLPLLKTYYKQDSAAMFTQLESMKQNEEIDELALNGLGMFFLYYGDWHTSRKILEEAEDQFPNSALRNGLLGDYYMDEGNYEKALSHYKKAKEYNFDYWDIDDNIETCEKQLAESD